MKYWPQQLNFRVFCVTLGCGISREIFHSGLSLTPQIRAFYQFHVYFTVRRILYQLGVIQNMSALPGDLTFNSLSNHYDVASYKRICAEFGIDPSSDFRFTHDKINGPGNVHKVRRKQNTIIQGGINSVMRAAKRSKETLFITLSRMFPLSMTGLLPKQLLAGLSRIKQSIEAFVYCILGAQVNVRSSILEVGGRAKEAQTEFLTLLMEDAIRQPDLPTKRAKISARGG